MYKYHFRPGYKSQELLIDIFDGAESDNFNSDLLSAIDELNPRMIDILDFWMNDDIIMTFDSDAGQFTISKDIWGFAFIMAESNQEVLARINSILENSEMFEKVEVDFENYK